MKGWIFVPLALLLGLIIGNWGPRGDLRAARQELENARRLLKDQSRRRGDLDGITRLIGIDDRARGGRKAGASRPAGPAPATGEAPSPGAGADAVGTNAVPETADAAPPTGDAGTDASTNATAEADAAPADGRTLKERIDQAAELWKARSNIARSTFLANLDLTPEEALQFDVLVGAMNLRIGNTLKNLAEGLKTNQEFNAEGAIGVANEVTGALVLAYKDMDRTLPADWRQKAGREFSLVDFVDPGVARPLIDVQDKLEQGREERPPRMEIHMGPRFRRGRSGGNVTVK